jgi:hypothetical protein
VLIADPQVTEWTGNIQVIGESQVGESRVRKVAAPASLVWDTTVADYHRTKLNHGLVIALIKEPEPVSLRCDGTEWETSPGGVVSIKMTVAVHTELKEALTAAAVGLPEDVKVKFTLAEDRQSAALELNVGEKVAPGVYDFVVTSKPLVMYQNNPEAAARAAEDQARIAKLVEGFKAERQQLAATAGTAPDASSPEIKQLDERIGRGEAALKEATDRAAKLDAAAKPAEKRCYVVSNVGALRVTEKAKQ